MRFLPLFRAFVGRFVSAAGVFAISVVVSRQLSLEETGQFFAGFTAVIALSILMQVGQNMLLIRRVALSAEDAQMWIGVEC